MKDFTNVTKDSSRPSDIGRQTGAIPRTYTCVCFIDLGLEWDLLLAVKGMQNMIPLNGFSECLGHFLHGVKHLTFLSLTA